MNLIDPTAPLPPRERAANMAARVVEKWERGIRRIASDAVDAALDLQEELGLPPYCREHLKFAEDMRRNPRTYAIEIIEEMLIETLSAPPSPEDAADDEAWREADMRSEARK